MWMCVWMHAHEDERILLHVCRDQRTTSVPASHLLCHCVYQGNWRFPFLCLPYPCGRVGITEACATVFGFYIGSGDLNTNISSWDLWITAIHPGIWNTTELGGLGWKRGSKGCCVSTPSLLSRKEGFRSTLKGNTLCSFLQPDLDAEIAWLRHSDLPWESI